jgi:hypothetical protein
LSRNIFEKHETKNCAENIAPAFLAMAIIACCSTKYESILIVWFDFFLLFYRHLCKRGNGLANPMCFQKYLTNLANQMQDFFSVWCRLCGVADWHATHYLHITKKIIQFLLFAKII